MSPNIYKYTAFIIHEGLLRPPCRAYLLSKDYSFCSFTFGDIGRSSGGMLCRSLHGRSPIHRLGACLSGPGHRLLTTGRYDLNDESPSPVTFEDVSTAMFRIRNGIKRTPCNRSHFLSELCGTSIYLKNEFSQFTGSFKERGARNALLLLTEEEKKAGVMAASAGNHALALAYHGTQLGIAVNCFMPAVAPLTKVDRCRKFGANVIITGAHIGEAKHFALTSPEYKGVKYINGYDDPEIVAGAGTIGIEVLEQIAQADVVVVPVGGAGLIAGVALAVKTLRPSCKVIGVEPTHCRSFQAALEHGKPVTADVSSTLADGLAVPMVGPTAFEVARRYVDTVVCVDEKMIALAMLRLLENERCVVEGGGAVGLAALLPGGPLDVDEYKDKNVVVLLCGGNIDITTLGRVIDRGLASDRRLIRFIATVENKCIVETTGAVHSEALRQKLLKEGYPLQWDVTASGMRPEESGDAREVAL